MKKLVNLVHEKSVLAVAESSGPLEQLEAKKQTDGSVRGKGVSNRAWKTRQTTRSSVAQRGGANTGNKAYQRRQAKKLAHQKQKLLEQELKDAALEVKLAKKRKREEKKKRLEENAKKSEVVQVITDTRKIKRMKRSQLKKIETR